MCLWSPIADVPRSRACIYIGSSVWLLACCGVRRTKVSCTKVSWPHKCPSPDLGCTHAVHCTRLPYKRPIANLRLVVTLYVCLIRDALSICGLGRLCKGGRVWRCCNSLQCARSNGDSYGSASSLIYGAPLLPPSPMCAFIIYCPLHFRALDCLMALCCGL